LKNEEIMTSRRIPWIGLSFLMVNLVMAFAVTFLPYLSFEYGFSATNPSFKGALGSLFIHQNILHLLGNMLVLSTVGLAVELALGWWRFTLVYILGGLVGVLAHWLIFRGNPDTGLLFGASSCLAACLGFAFIRFRTYQIPFLLKFSAPVWMLLGLWILLQIVGLFVQVGQPSTGGVAFAAHLGGLAVGLIASGIWRADKQAELDDAYRLLGDAEDRSAGAKMTAAQQVLKQKPGDAVATVRLAEAQKQMGDNEAFYQTLQLLVDSKDKDSIEWAVTEMAANGQLKSLSSGKLMRISQDLPAQLQSIVWQSVASRTGDTERPKAILELVEAKATGNWADILTKEFPMEPETEIARQKGLLNS